MRNYQYLCIVRMNPGIFVQAKFDLILFKKSFGVRNTLVRFWGRMFRYVIHEICNFTPRKQHFHTPSTQLNLDAKIEYFAD